MTGSSFGNFETKLMFDKNNFKQKLAWKQKLIYTIKMRVGILTNTYPPNLNGVSVSVFSLKQNLEKLGVKVFIATPGVKGFKYPKNILPLRSASIPKQISPDLKLPYLYTNQVKKFFTKNKVDIIHTHDTFLGGPEGAMLGLEMNLPTIHTFHTITEDYQYFPIPGYKQLVSNIIRDVCNQYDHIIAPSRKVYQYLLQKGVGSPISNILNVPNLEDITKKPTITAIKTKIEKLKIEADDFVFVTFCRLAKEKGIYEGIQVLEPLFKKYPKIKYLLAGWGPEEDKIKKYVTKHKLQNQVLFYGKYDRSELPLIAKLSKVFLFTSTTENLPTNIWEAAYLGLPVVSIDDSSIDYILKNDFNSLVGDIDKLTDLATKIYKNPDLLQELATNAHISAVKLNPLTIAKNHLELYQQVIDIHGANAKETNLISELIATRWNNLIKKGLLKTQQSYKKLIKDLGLGG